MEKFLIPIPAKRYFTIGEASNLCGVKAHVLRYWEQEFKQLRPMKRRSNRRYYQHHEVLIIRKIRDLLYDQGFTIIGARNKLDELAQNAPGTQLDDEAGTESPALLDAADFPRDGAGASAGIEQIPPEISGLPAAATPPQSLHRVRRELLEIRDLLRLA